MLGKLVYRVIGHPHARFDYKPTPDSRFPLAYEMQGHERELIDYFSKKGRQFLPPVLKRAETTDNIMLCFTNRCGSNWLAELLAATGLVGLADEELNAERVEETCRYDGLTSFHDFLHHLPSKQAVPGGRFALKISWCQLYFLARHGIVPDVFPRAKYVLMTRRDIAAQALSLCVAFQTGQWKSNWNSGQLNRFDPMAITDAELIDKIREITNAHMHFQRYFATFGITPHIVVYEDLLADPEAELNRLLSALGIAEPGQWSIDRSKLVLEKQRTSQTQERLERFKQRMQGFS